MPFGQSAVIGIVTHQLASTLCFGFARGFGKSREDAQQFAQDAAIKIAASATGTVGLLTADAAGITISAAYLAAQAAAIEAANRERK